MSARDPVAVLRECAHLLDPESQGAMALDVLADREMFGHDLGHGRTLHEVLGELGWTARYTPDERAAFALAREALAPVAGVDGTVAK